MNDERGVFADNMRTACALGLVLSAAFCGSMSGYAQTVESQLWATDNTVTAIARSGNTIYIGGAFRWVGPCTGGGVVLSANDGALIDRFPKVDGGVQAAVPDGAGGWYIGGLFTAVGGVRRANLAHVLGDGSVASWNPGTNTAVSCLALSRNILYVGGFFATIGGKSRQYLAAVDATTGETTAWDPHPNGLVMALATVGHTLYVGGGQFSAIAGRARGNLAAVDVSTGELTGWNPGADGPVYSITIRGRAIYVGGKFTVVGGLARSCVAAIDALSGEVAPWNPSASAMRGSPQIRGLVLAGDVIYVGGYYSGIGGQQRAGIAALDLTTATATDWDPRPGGAVPFVGAIGIHGRTVYLGGEFSEMGGQPRTNAAAVDAKTGVVTGWNSSVRGGVATFSVAGDAVYMGGSFKIIGGGPRRGLAALDATTGTLKNWIPNPNGLIIYSLAVAGGTVYAGGDFSNIGGQARTCIAALDTLTGAATDWNPMADGIVRSLVIGPSVVYAGGGFTHVGGQARRYIAALDRVSGSATSWDPSANDWVFSLSLSGNTLYAGGFFSRIGGQPRSAVAALDATTGFSTSWDPHADRFAVVEAVAVSDSTVFVGGAIDFIGGQARNEVAALDAVTAGARSWNPNPTGALQGAAPVVHAIATSGNAVYIGGDFYSIGGRVRKFLAAVDATSGAALDWDPGADNVVWSVAMNQTAVYAGGVFNSIGGLPQSCFAALSMADPPNAKVSGTEPSLSVRLAQNSPNPASARTTIQFTLLAAAPVTLAVYDIQGRRVANLLGSQPCAAGPHSISLSTNGWPAGRYLYRLEVGGKSATRKMLVIR